MSDAARSKVRRAKSGRRHRTGDARPGTPFTAESVARRLIETVAADFEDRNGGYTRIIKLADTRIGDGSSLAVLQLVGREEDPGSVRRGEPTARRRRIEARYAMAEKGSPRMLRAEETARAEKRAEAAAGTAEPEGDAEDGEAADEADTQRPADHANDTSDQDEPTQADDGTAEPETDTDKNADT
jgi:large subunit ribosomal protein L17